MTGMYLKQRLLAALWLGSMIGMQPSFAREAPATGCIDLRKLSGGWRSGERELLIQSQGNTGARLTLDSSCPVIPEGVDIVTLAPGGWACPGKRISVRGGDTTCPVAQMSLLSETELVAALRTREAHVQHIATLKPIEVRARNWRDIRGTTDRCVDKRFLRGWSWGDDGLVIEVSPRRHSGNRYYRIETVESCSDLAHADTIELEALNRSVAICGRPGDRLWMQDRWYQEAQEARSGAGVAGMQIESHVSRMALRQGCEISKVTPLPNRRAN